MNDQTNENPLESFFDHICGDMPREELVMVILPDGTVEIVTFLIDLEMDPVRVTFANDPAAAIIHADDYKYCMLTPYHLDLLSELAERAQIIWKRWFKTHDCEKGPAEKHLRMWLAMGDSGADLRATTVPRPPEGSRPFALPDKEQ